MKKTVKKELPENAKKVFAGKIFDVWQWEQEMFDGSTETFEKLSRPDTAIVIASVDDTILLQTQEQPHSPRPFPSIPGGRIDDREEPIAGAKRELLEESGYTSDDWTLWKELRPMNKIIWTVHIFFARNCRKKREPKLDAGEKITTRLISFDEFLDLGNDEAFYEKELSASLMRAQLDPIYRAELKKKIFGR